MRRQNELVELSTESFPGGSNRMFFFLGHCLFFSLTQRERTCIADLEPPDATVFSCSERISPQQRTMGCVKVDVSQVNHMRR